MKIILSFLLISLPLFASIQAEDPYAWLEEMESPKTVEWTQAQNEKAQTYLEQVPQRGQIRERLQILSDYENYGLPFQEGERLFFFKRDRGEELHYLAMQEPSGEMRVLVASELHRPILNFEVSGDGIYVAYSVSDAGADKQVWKFVNVETGEILPDRIEGIQFSCPIWSEDKQGVYYISYEETAIYYHKLGMEKDQLLFRMKSDGKKLFLGLSQPFENTLLFQAITGWSRDNAVYLLDLEEGKVSELIPFDQGQYHFMGKIEGKLLFLTDYEANRHKLVAYDMGWSDLIPECDNTLIEATVVDGKIICHYLEDCASILERYDTYGQFLDNIPLPGKGTAWLASESPFFSYTDVTTPRAIYHYDEGVYFKPHADDLKGYVTKQLFFSSKDGTRIPLFITHREGIKLTGDHPTFLYGYGGFNISLTPYYSPLIATWLEMGGLFVSVNMRGGGEYGKTWHEGGSLTNKQNGFDDFIAAAEFLIESGYTHPSKLVVNGCSNGGLLVGACLTQRPDLFAAAIPQVGVLDMLKFHQFTIGWSWMSDYGNPDDSNDFSFLYAYSPYHNVKEGVSYPPTLITTADHDDRVVPLHSYKFAARLQEAQGGSAPILLRVYTDTGHGMGRSLEQAIEENTDILSFIFDVVTFPIP